ncbi:hypothetical protein [Deinococcus kurensis]|uniref:hypothetical protein n=1 Tax=Deinococcus kurensis TaxID=2662757 RepID=UPI0012D33C96|nr:hypothetical protein [Deinococcus kurensis]
MNFGQLIDQLRGTFGEHVMHFDDVVDVRDRTVMACGMTDEDSPEPFVLLVRPGKRPAWQYVVSAGSEDLSPQVMQSILTLPVQIAPIGLNPNGGFRERDQRIDEILAALHPHKEELT